MGTQIYEIGTEPEVAESGQNNRPEPGEQEASADERIPTADQPTDNQNDSPETAGAVPDPTLRRIPSGVELVQAPGMRLGVLMCVLVLTARAFFKCLGWYNFRNAIPESLIDTDIGRSIAVQQESNIMVSMQEDDAPAEVLAGCRRICASKPDAMLRVTCYVGMTQAEEYKASLRDNAGREDFDKCSWSEARDRGIQLGFNAVQIAEICGISPSSAYQWLAATAWPKEVTEAVQKKKPKVKRAHAALLSRARIIQADFPLAHWIKEIEVHSIKSAVLKAQLEPIFKIGRERAAEEALRKAMEKAIKKGVSREKAIAAATTAGDKPTDKPTDK